MYKHLRVSIHALFADEVQWKVSKTIAGFGLILQGLHIEKYGDVYLQRD